MKKENELQERKPGKYKLKMTFAILILAALSVVELYLMMNYQTEYLYLGIVGLGILCFVYWVVDISFKMQQEKDSVGEWEYENLYKAEKVSYISMKQSFSDIEKMLQDMADLPVDDVIQSQKAVGKVMIRRNKENTQTIMDSHKELAERIDAMEAKINELKEAFDAVSVQSEGGAANIQQEILDILRRLEVSGIQNIQPSQEPVPQEESSMEEPMIDTQSAEESDLFDEAVAEEEPTTEMPEMESVAPVEEPEAKETVIPTEIAAEEEPETEIPEVESIAPAEESIAEETSTPEEVAAEETPAIDEAPLIPEEKPDMPDLSDPGHVMTPEEIAALLANM